MRRNLDERHQSARGCPLPTRSFRNSRPVDRAGKCLRRLDCKHANSTSLPSATDGRDTIMDPKIYSTAVARLLGLPVYNNSIPCPLCQQSMDVLGDHALCCKKTQDT